ncbi:transcription termination factor NusA [Flexithrix dorotheae]|uniref:transcription termination factor NusA n=1 Tax=Flexithrix dorotheae TaxID=70993 RepID=UPI00037D72B6|nr:transcription termination factor NusA [Flexithrix dorotheae]
MNSSILIESFADFAKLKNIDRPTMIRILEDVFRTMVRRKFGTDQNFDVIINVDKGDLEIWRYREIVEDDAEVEDENLTIRLSQAKKIEADFEVGEEVAEEVKILDFGRRQVQTARQTLIQKVKDLEKDILFQKYKDLVGEMVTCEVYQVLSRELILIDSEKNELSLPKTEQIYKDRFRKGDNVRAIIHRVEMVNNNPKIILSRTSPVFLERLFEGEVPEVFDGLITIKKVVREPGERAKVAVESYDDRIDPVGACVGMKGSRIHSIVRELQNENIDVINYTDNIDLYIARALSPAKINNIKVDADNGRVSVFLDRDQVSLAIGKGGQNIKLASKLVGMEIDVFRELGDFEDDEEDVELREFVDVIDEWMIDELRRIGLDTAKTVLAISPQDLLRRTELEEESIDFIRETLRKEFD